MLLYCLLRKHSDKQIKYSQKPLSKFTNELRLCLILERLSPCTPAWQIVYRMRSELQES
jgi:hypothetical protein